MKTKIKHDKDFFFKFMMGHGYYEDEVRYFWNIFISGCDYHDWKELDKDVIDTIDLFDRVYGDDYEKEGD